MFDSSFTHPLPVEVPQLFVYVQEGFILLLSVLNTWQLVSVPEINGQICNVLSPFQILLVCELRRVFVNILIYLYDCESDFAQLLQVFGEPFHFHRRFGPAVKAFENLRIERGFNSEVELNQGLIILVAQFGRNVSEVEIGISELLEHAFFVLSPHLEVRQVMSPPFRKNLAEAPHAPQYAIIHIIRSISYLSNLILMKSVLAPPAQLKRPQDAFRNAVFLSKTLLDSLRPPLSPPFYLKIKNYLFSYVVEDSFGSTLGMNKLQRQFLRVGMTDQLEVFNFKPKADQSLWISHLTLQLRLPVPDAKLQIDDQVFVKEVLSALKEVILNVGQGLLINQSQKNQVHMFVTGLKRASLGIQTETQAQYGLVYQQTDIQFVVKEGHKIKLKSQGKAGKSLFRPDFKFEDMKIGGLDSQLANIFRRAFASRRFPPAMIQKFGIKHVKGLLLFGPPGTGKTLIARQLSKVLKAKQPKIVNGPQIFSKFVGESEENVRKLFVPARQDMARLGQESPLHVIIFDEIDAICKQRGSVNSGTNTHDTVVNQLLTNIDGVQSLDNILVIGMTNRKDLIDEAILRPGRFQVHIEVGLPDEKGRQDIFKIHAESMIKNNILDSSVDFGKLASNSRNYTGAQIQALVKSAASFAMSRAHNLTDFTKKIQINHELKVEMRDFQAAFAQIKPMFGMDTQQFQVYLRHPLVNYGPKLQKIRNIYQNAFRQTREGLNMQLTTILLENQSSGCGSTSIAAQAANLCGFPFVKLISPQNFVGYSDNGKVQSIVKVFQDAYRSKLSCIVLDNIERLVQLVEVGMRFNNVMLQTLLVLLKKIPRKSDNRLLIIGTTSSVAQLQHLDIPKNFNLRVRIPELQQPELYKVFEAQKLGPEKSKSMASMLGKCPIKQALSMVDMMGKEGGLDKFQSIVQSYSFRA